MMIKKAKLFEENNKLKRMYFIFQNIGVGTNSTIREKEIAAKKFKEKFLIIQTTKYVQQ